MRKELGAASTPLKNVNQPRNEDCKDDGCQPRMMKTAKDEVCKDGHLASQGMKTARMKSARMMDVSQG